MYKHNPTTFKIYTYAFTAYVYNPCKSKRSRISFTFKINK